MSAKRTQRSYDHRLQRLVGDTGDATIATRIGVPRSTVAGCAALARLLCKNPLVRARQAGAFGS